VVIFSKVDTNDIYHLNLTMSCQQMEKSKIFIMLIIVLFAPTAGAPFTPNTIGLLSSNEKLLL